MRIKPLMNRVVIEPISQEEKTKSGIFIPQTSEKDLPEEGKVVAVGKGRVLKSGEQEDMEVKVGDSVLFNKYGPTEVKVDDKKYLIAKKEDILAVLE